MTSRSARCCGTPQDGGRSTLGVITLLLSAGALLYLLIEFTERTVLPGVPNDADALLWCDLASAALVLLAGMLLLSPDWCCSIGKHLHLLRRERVAAFGLMLLAAFLSGVVSARVRNHNMRNDRQDESYVCGRLDHPSACPSRRVTLSDAYNRWRLANAEATECWFNTSSVHPESFVWGAAFRFATRYRTADFSQEATYTTFEQFAPCFYYGCADACLPEQRDFNERLLRFEALMGVAWSVLAVLAVCARARYDTQVYAPVAHVLP